MNRRLKILAVMMLLFTACAPAQTDAVKVGAVLSLTSYAAYYGENSQQGMELAVQEINAAGGINGKPLQVIYEDDATDPTTAVTAVRKLVDVNNVDAIIGGTWGPSLETIVPQAQNMIVITPSTGNTELNSRLSDTLFRTWPSVDRFVQSFREVIQKNNFKRIVIIRHSGSWAFAHKTSLENLLGELGGVLLADIEFAEYDNNVVYTETIKAIRLKPDAIFLAVGPNDASAIAKQLRVNNASISLLATEGVLDEALKLGLVDADDLPDAYYANPLAQDESFIEKYKDEFGTMPGMSADTAYKAVHILADAYKQTGTTDTEVVQEYLQNSVLFDEWGDIRADVRLSKV